MNFRMDPKNSQNDAFDYDCPMVGIKGHESHNENPNQDQNSMNSLQDFSMFYENDF